MDNHKFQRIVDISVEAKIAKIMASNARRCTLANLLSILDQFNFSKNFQIITIAGTNGKGTAVTMLEELVMANNKQVLSHTSPHVFKFNERISLNKEPVANNILLELLEKLERLTLEYKLSYYQIAFLCACLYSQENKNLDYFILEVGVGGRLDAANILDPDITAITNIALDHCEILGNNLESIGIEKAAISRQRVPLFLGSEMPNSVYEYARIVGACVYYQNYKSRLKVCFQHSYNVAMGLAAHLLKKRQIAHIPKLEHIKARARFNIFKNDKINNSYVVVDVAHNPAAVKHLFKLLDDNFNSKKIKYRAIFGILATKDVATIISIAKTYVYKWDIVDLKRFDNRALDLHSVQRELSKQGIVRVALNNDLSTIHLPHNMLTVVFGSFVLAGEFIKKYETNYFK